MNTPWGPSQDIEHIAAGIISVSTAGHGGIHLSPERIKQLPASAGRRTFNGGLTWWEEDCDWSVPFLVFAEEYKAYYAPRHGAERFAQHLAAARKTAEIYHPEFLAELDAQHSRVSLFD